MTDNPIVTDEMIEAGRRTLGEHMKLSSSGPEILRDVYLAMHEARPIEAMSALSRGDDVVCRNCAGEEWVCENHEDRPWNDKLAIGCECGAGAPCPVCNRDMACAPYTPHWQSIESAPRDGTSILIAGGAFDDDTSMGGEMPFKGVAIVSWRDGWQGEQRAHDEWFWHKPTHWMPLPEPPLSRGNHE